jgi:hypothetical protein
MVVGIVVGIVVAVGGRRYRMVRDREGCRGGQIDK